MTVGNDAVQEVFTGKNYYKYDEAWVVSNCQFTKRAREEAKRLRVKLVQHNDLFSILNRMDGFDSLKPLS